jgi:hypothetical protein
MVYLHFVNQKNLGSSPQVKFILGTLQYSTILDTGCEASIMSEILYRELKALSCRHKTLFWSERLAERNRMRKQVYLTMNFGEVSVDHAFLVSEQLIAPTLIGYDFCIAN